MEANQNKIVPVFAVKFKEVDYYQLVPEFFDNELVARKTIQDQVGDELHIERLVLAGLFSAEHGAFISKDSDGSFYLGYWTNSEGEKDEEA